MAHFAMEVIIHVDQCDAASSGVGAVLDRHCWFVS
jgi:hypothetical protein